MVTDIRSQVGRDLTGMTATKPQGAPVGTSTNWMGVVAALVKVIALVAWAFVWPVDLDGGPVADALGDTVVILAALATALFEANRCRAQRT